MTSSVHFASTGWPWKTGVCCRRGFCQGPRSPPRGSRSTSSTPFPLTRSRLRTSRRAPLPHKVTAKRGVQTALRRCDTGWVLDGDSFSTSFFTVRTARTALCACVSTKRGRCSGSFRARTISTSSASTCGYQTTPRAQSAVVRWRLISTLRSRYGNQWQRHTTAPQCFLYRAQQLRCRPWEVPLLLQRMRCHNSSPRLLRQGGGGGRGHRHGRQAGRMQQRHPNRESTMLQGM